MAEVKYKGSLCDRCLFACACEEMINEPDNCTIICVRKTDPLYRVFEMAYNKGYNDALDECEAEFDEFNEEEGDYNS